jgi:molecular chaperone DnaK
LDIDANGILSVSAKDKNTGKENKITIKANSGLSDAEIAKMVKEAEENAEADKRERELVDARNNAESTLNGMRKEFDKYSAQMEEADRTKLEEAMAAVTTALAGDDPEAIQNSIPPLYEASNPLYKIKTEAEKPVEETATADSTASEAAPAAEGTTVDAEFKETK